MSEKNMLGVREILRGYVSDARNFSLLTFHLDEVREGAQRYMNLYEQILALPSEDAARRDALVGVLIQMKVLLEDVTGHADELRKEIDTALDEVDQDDEETPP